MTTALKIDELRARFVQLLHEHGTSEEALNPRATWRAFAAFCREGVACDDEALFFETGVTPDETRFYLHFTRTLFGREAGGYFWSHEVKADFLFEPTGALRPLEITLEVEDLAELSEEREAFLQDAEAQAALWKALENQNPVAGMIYVGES